MKRKISPTQRMLNTWAIVIIIWSVFRSHFKTELPIWIDEFVAKPLIFLTPVMYYIRSIEMKPIAESLWLRTKHWRSDVLFSLAVGAMFYASAAGANYAKYRTLLPPEPRFLETYALPLLLVVAVASSIWEEVLSRGFVTKRLYEDSKNIWTASFYSSILFFFMHIPILFTSRDITGYTILQVMATDLMLSFVISYLFIYRRSLIVPIIIHALYNISLYIFL